MAKAESDRAAKEVGQRDAVVKEAQELLFDQQKQSKELMEQRLAEARKALEKDLKSAQKTIEDLQLRIAELEADKIRDAQMAIISLQRPPSGKSEVAAPAPKRRQSVAPTGILGHVDFDETRPLGEQLKENLQKHAIRVLDLFREWDENGDGEISKKEFRHAMPKLGFDMPANLIDEVFDGYDLDGSGVMDFKELQKMLKGGPSKGNPVKALQTKPTSAGKKKPANKWQAAAADATETTMEPEQAKTAKLAANLFGKK